MIDTQSFEILKYINKNGKTKIEDIHTTYGKTDQTDRCIDLLKNRNYIKGLSNRSGYVAEPLTKEIKFVSFFASPYEITPEGKAYIEKHKIDKSERRFTHFHIWTNTVIALFALIVATIALFK